MNTQESKNCSCCKIAKIVVAGLILLCSATSAFYSYKTSKTLDAIIAPQAAQSKSITEAYAKGKSLEDAKATGKPVVAVFYADWCGYCKKFAPTFAKIIKKRQFKSNLAAAFINGADESNSKYMKEYNVQGFPTVIMINFETGEKTRVPNNLLFTPSAEKDLLTKFLDFAKK